MTHLTLSGRSAIVTGGARRIGAALVRGLHEAGAGVCIHYRHSGDAAERLAETLNGARRGSAVVHQADLDDVAALPALIDAAHEAFGRLDILVNNASTFFPTAIGETTEAQWNTLHASNVKAPFFLAQAAAPALRDARGTIVNLVDIHARRPLRGFAAYSAAKAGLTAVTRALARELAPDVRVNGIAPGAILWPESGIDEAAKQAIIDATALGRSGTPDDIVAAALFLIADAPYVTGQILAVDGGRSIGWQ